MERKNVFLAALWMVGITLALFFLPLINGLIGGAIGGYKAGTWRRALVAALIPAVVVAIALWVLLIAFELPIVGFVAGATAGIVIFVADLGILVGALAGGAYAESRRHAVHA